MSDTARTIDESGFEARVATGLERLAERVPVGAPGAFDLQRPERQSGRARRPSPVLVAAAVAIATVGGLVALSYRPSSPAPADVPAAPSTSVPSEAVDLAEAVEMAPGRALVPDRPPEVLADATITAGGRLEPIDDIDGYNFGPVRRWYTSSPIEPERTAWIALDAMDAERMAPDVADGAVQVTVQGVVGEIFDDQWRTTRSLAFTIDGTTYVLFGDNLDDADLVEAAEHVRPSANEYGAVIESNGLPDGVVERAAGTVFETWFISRESLSAPSPMLRIDQQPAQVWMEARQEPAELLGLHRLGFSRVTDVTVHGQPAFVTTLAVQPEYRGVTWHEEGVTYQLGSNHLSEADVLELAEGLRPATLSEWNELVSATEQRETDDINEPPPTTAVVAETASTTLVAPASTTSRRVLVANASDTAGIAGATTRRLRLDGYEVLEAVNAAANVATLEESIVIARAEREDLRDEIAAHLGIDAVGTLEPDAPLPIDGSDIDPEDVAVLVMLGSDVDLPEEADPTSS